MAQVFVPLNRFQSVVATLTGEQDEIYVTPAGVSSIVLSCQITNNSYQNQPVTIFVTSNKELPIPNFEGVEATGSYTSASALLTLNRQFIRKETAAYVQYQNNLSETPFSFTSSLFENYALDEIDAFAYDIKNNTTIIKGGTRRYYPNILMMPIKVIHNLIKYGKIIPSIFWDLLGFADFVIAKKK